jgi:hypothetical protein
MLLSALGRDPEAFPPVQVPGDRVCIRETLHVRPLVFRPHHVSRLLVELRSMEWEQVEIARDESD